MRIAVMGSGGLGAYFGMLAVRAGHGVTFVARGSHLRAIRESGLLVRTPGQEMLVKPAKATDDPTEVGVVDLIFFCVKAYDAEAAAAQIKPMVGAQTTVIPVLNGIAHIEMLTQNVGAEHVVGGVALVSGHREAPGVIGIHTTGTYLRFGELDGSLSERCAEVQSQLAVEGIMAAPNITVAMWRKLANVCGVGVCSVVRAPFGEVAQYPETIALFAQCLQEVVSVSNAARVPLGNNLVSEAIESLRNFPQVKPSMLVDLEHGNRLEVQWLNGDVSRMGKELGVRTPVNDFIYGCLKPWANGPSN